jgi:hypothetical protein
VRTTKDVDILLRRPDLQRVADVLAPLGFVMHEVLGVYMFVGRRRPSPKTGVHVILAREKVRSHDTHAVPDPSQYVVTREGFRVIALAELVAMKLQAYRLIDRAHLVDLRNVGLVTPDLIASLPPDLHERWAALNREEPESR